MIGKIVEAIGKIFGFLAVSKQKEQINRYRRAIDIAERYIFKTDELIQAKALTKQRRLKRQLNSLRRAFFKYNQ